jgi:hypothetical protein
MAHSRTTVAVGFSYLAATMTLITGVFVVA